MSIAGRSIHPIRKPFTTYFRMPARKAIAIPVSASIVKLARVPAIGDHELPELESLVSGITTAHRVMYTIRLQSEKRRADFIALFTGHSSAFRTIDGAHFRAQQKSLREEPDASIAHVRICGGLRRAIALLPDQYLRVFERCCSIDVFKRTHFSLRVLAPHVESYSIAPDSAMCENKWEPIHNFRSDKQEFSEGALSCCVRRTFHPHEVAPC